MKDFEYKKENLISILEQTAADKSKQVKCLTKGKFAEVPVEHPG